MLHLDGTASIIPLAYNVCAFHANAHRRMNISMLTLGLGFLLPEAALKFIRLLATVLEANKSNLLPSGPEAFACCCGRRVTS